MKFIALFFYNVAVRFYRLGIFIASFFNKKAKLWIDGRKNWKSRLSEKKRRSGKRIWVHCASLGEFEQARPLIEKIKNEKPDSVIIITFFSPSGFEVQKNYAQADLVLYLPLDTKANATAFIEVIKPDLALFTKYDFWYHHLYELKKRNIPTILFSAVFREEQIFFRCYGGLFREMLHMFSKIFVQNAESRHLLQSINIDSEIAFDTRFDRVIQISKNRKHFPLIEKFKGDSKILIAGSTWEKDEELIIECINKDVLKEYKYIIAPHEIIPSQIVLLEKSIRVNAKRFSELNDTNASEVDVVIIDNIGNLSSLYAYGDIAYVGGGFNSGVHNILEAAVCGIPVLFGPNHKKSLEANDLLFRNVDGYNSFESAVKMLENEKERKSAGEKNTAYVKSKTGGTEKIFNYLKEKI